MQAATRTSQSLRQGVSRLSTQGVTRTITAAPKYRPYEPSNKSSGDAYLEQNKSDNTKILAKDKPEPSTEQDKKPHLTEEDHKHLNATRPFWINGVY